MVPVFALSMPFVQAAILWWWPEKVRSPGPLPTVHGYSLGVARMTTKTCIPDERSVPKEFWDPPVPCIISGLLNTRSKENKRCYISMTLPPFAFCGSDAQDSANVFRGEVIGEYKGKEVDETDRPDLRKKAKDFQQQRNNHVKSSQSGSTSGSTAPSGQSKPQPTVPESGQSSMPGHPHQSVQPGPANVQPQMPNVEMTDAQREDAAYDKIFEESIHPDAFT